MADLLTFSSFDLLNIKGVSHELSTLPNLSASSLPLFQNLHYSHYLKLN